MELREIIEEIASNARNMSTGTHNWKGMVFQSHVYDGMSKPFVSTTHARKKKKFPTVVIWRLRDGSVRYSWFNLILHELVGSDSTSEKNTGIEGRYVHTYYTKELICFNKEQSEAIVSGTYDSMHDKFSDIFSEDLAIFLIYRDKFDGNRYKKVIENKDWYFYIRSEDYRKMMEVLEAKGFDTHISHTEPEGDEWLRIYCVNRGAKYWNYRSIQARDHSYMVKKALQGIVDTFEADLDPADRYAIDNELKVETDLRILYYDIETDDSTREIDMEKNPILSIGAVNDLGEEFWKCTKDEKSMIEWWADVSMHYDIIVGWNSYSFDAEYIYERGKKYRIFWKPHFRKMRLGHVDLMKRIIGTMAKFIQVRSYKLDDIGYQFVGERKVTYEGRIIDLFNNDRKKLKEYNLWDCHLVKKIDEKMGITKLMVALCEWTGTFPTMFRPTKAMSGVSVSKLLDMYVLRNARGTGIHYPTATWDDKDKTKFLGGLVMEAVPGIYKDVYILDFKSLYPTVVWTWKISPETIRYDDKTEERLVKSAQPGVWFYKDHRSMFPHLIESLMQARRTYKNMMLDCEPHSPEYDKYDVMQNVAKELNNSMYGVLGQRGNRYFDINVAGSVTAAGRHLLRKVKEICEEYGIKVIYGDTDSVFITGLQGMEIHDLVKKINVKVEEHIKEEFGVDESIIELEYEKKMGRFIQVGGKNYACRLTEKDGKEVDEDAIKGLACVKRNTIEFAKREQEKLIHLLLREDNPKEFYINHVSKLRREWFTSIADVNDIVCKTSVSKWPSEYTSTGPHIRVAQKLIDSKREFWPKMQVPYVIVNKALKGEVHVDDYAGEYDRGAYWEKIYKPLQALLQVCFTDYDWGYHLKNVASKPKKPRCPLCGYVVCRCEDEVETKVEEVKPTPKKRGRFIIKKTNHNQLF